MPVEGWLGSHGNADMQKASLGWRPIRLRPFDASGPIGLTGDVAQRGGQQGFVTFAGRFSELTSCPGEDVDETDLRGGGESSVKRARPHRDQS